MRHPTSETSMHRIIGITTCMLASALIIIGSNPDLPTWSTHQVDVQTRVLVRILIAFSMWLFGSLFAAWPDIRDFYFPDTTPQSPFRTPRRRTGRGASRR